MPHGSPQIPGDLAQLASEKGFSLDLVRRALTLGFPPQAIKGQIESGATAEQAQGFRPS